MKKFFAVAVLLAVSCTAALAADGTMTSDASALKTMMVWGLGIFGGFALLVCIFHIIQHSMALSSGSDPNAKSKLITSLVAAGFICGAAYLATIISNKASSTFNTGASNVLPGR